MLTNDKGFTLVEIIAVLIIIGILAGVAVPRYIDLTSAAELKVIEAALTELNARERLTFAQNVLAPEGYKGNKDFDLGGYFVVKPNGLKGYRPKRLTCEYSGDKYRFLCENFDGVKKSKGAMAKRWVLEKKL